MSFAIKNGKGGKYEAEVNADNQLEVFATIEPVDRRQNRIEGNQFSLPFTGVDPVGANDVFFYLKNTGTNTLAISDVRIESSVAGTVEVLSVQGTPSYTSSSDITPVNRNIGKSNSVDAIIKTDTDTTGLTVNGVIFYITCSTADTIYHLRTTSNILIEAGQAVALRWDTSTGILKGVVSLTRVSNLR